MSKEEHELLANLLAAKNTFEGSLAKLEKQLIRDRTLLHDGRRTRRELGYHMGNDVGNNPPCGSKYLENIEQIIIPRLVSDIYSANSNIERLTSQIEELTRVAVPVAEEVVEEVMGPSVFAVSAPAVFAVSAPAVSAPAVSAPAPKKLRRMSSSSSSDGEGRRSRRKRKKKKRTRRHRRRHRRSTGRNKRKSRKYH